MSDRITAWRITQARYAEERATGGALSGEGARGYGGRWNSRGTALAYTAGSRSLALLEVLVHTESTRLLGRYVLLPVTFDAHLVETLEADQLPDDWRSHPAPASTQAIGDAWVRSQRSIVLRVPSVILPAEPNFIINPLHDDFGALLIGQPEGLDVDGRFLGIER
jgi:RES domain-containing protein